jgi:hypothetical protein
MSQHLVLILGGYGVFGSRVARNLAQHPELSLIVAGRDQATATAFARTVDSGRCQAMAIDVSQPDGIATILATRPMVVVDAVGPFQSRSSELARDCALNGIHYVDIADARARVAGIVKLDPIARAHDVTVISGASTVPAITTAIVDDLEPDPTRVLEIDVGISPGHRAPRGLATVRSIFSYCGNPIPAVCGGVEFGWGGLARHRYPLPVGSRWLSHVDTPERELWRSRYPSLRKATIRAGFEIGPLHLVLSAASRVARMGVISSLEPYASFAIRVADICNRLGTDTGAMHVRVVAGNDVGEIVVRTGVLIAEKGDGPQVPATPAALIVKKLLRLPGYAPLATRGAIPCIGLLSRAEIFAELRPFAIRYIEDDE